MDKIKNILIDFFELPQNYNEQKININQLKGWDSAKHVELIILLETELSIEYDPEDIPKLVSYDKIIENTKKYLAK